MEEILPALPSLHGVIVLMYHRIDVTDTDPWGICVSPDHFEEQVRFLKNNFNIISTKELISQVTTGNITGNSICITFDDGYADNYIHAKPILEKYNCSATFFISTGFINQIKPFWWDELDIIFLHSKKLPCQLSLRIDGRAYEYKLEESELTKENWQQHQNWQWHTEPPTDRCTILMNVWDKLRPLPYQEIERQMAVIKKWAGIYDSMNTHRIAMNEQQLNELSKNNLFTVGLHTHTHPDMEGKEKQFQVEEILSCKKILRSKYGIESNSLAYPYGKYDNNTIKAVKELQIEGCFTTKTYIINANSDLAKLGRCQVFDWDIVTFIHQLDVWINDSDLKTK